MDSVSSEIKQRPAFGEEFRRLWWSFPDKRLFGVLLLAWLGVFYFWGSPSLGYRDLRTPNLFYWMYYAYTNPGSEDNHGVLIPFAVLGLLWWKRLKLIECTKTMWSPALVGLAVAGLLHLVGYMMQQQRLSIVALFAGIYSLVALVWGGKLAGRCFFPFILFVYCIPVGMMVDTVTLPLRQMATNVSVWISQFIFGIEVIKDGIRIVDPGGVYQYEVAAACSGLRSLIAMSALTTIYGFMNFEKPWKQWLVVFSAFPIAIAGNVLRLLFIILAAESLGKGAGEFVHEWFGFVTFVLAMAVLLAMGRWLKDRPEASPAPLIQGSNYAV